MSADISKMFREVSLRQVDRDWYHWNGLTFGEAKGWSCMTLRKWRSSSTKLMDTVPENLQESQPTQHITSPHDCHKALGIHWDTAKDTLHIATPKLDDSVTPTKQVFQMS